MTPEEIAESQATWQEQRDAADAEKNFAADRMLVYNEPSTGTSKARSNT